MKDQLTKGAAFDDQLSSSMTTYTNINPFISVNFHLTNKCNYSCKFCFAKFSCRSITISYRNACKIIDQFVNNGAEKMTFVGGEPFLYLKLGDLVQYAKNQDLITMIVTNGSLLNHTFLTKYGEVIDWIGLSIDSGIDLIEQKLGRCPKSRQSKFYSHVDKIRYISQVIKDHGIQLKINTVITSLNWQEDMHWLINELNPGRWKVFQVLKINGENDENIDPLLINSSQLNTFKEFHRDLNPIIESNDMMINSYVMIDPLGRFFDNHFQRLNYSQSILDIGLLRAFNEVFFSNDKFYQCGGIYNWK